VGSNHARRLRMEETDLCSRWQLSMKRGSSQDEVRGSKRTQTIVSVSKGPQNFSFSV
jgi:hypothetical protein